MPSFFFYPYLRFLIMVVASGALVDGGFSQALEF